MPQVISASRRTDIPAFYSEWFVNRLKAGSVFVRQPYSGRMNPVLLGPEHVAAIVFWSKNYGPLLPRLDEIERTTKRLFFHFTITANRDLESATPDYRDAARDYRHLARRYSPEQLVWRFDPICITDKLSFEIAEERFLRLAELLKGHARECIISFVHPYKKVLANLQKYTDHRLVDPPEEQKLTYARRLARKAEAFGIRLSACCNDYLLSDDVGKAHCIDGSLLSRLFGAPLDARPAGTRATCGCSKSADIGAYDTCGHGCIYCYANSDKKRAEAAVQRHDPQWNSLTGQVEE